MSVETPDHAEGQGPEVDWQPWDRQTFERAAAEHRLILISVQAGWCHWCHVMNDTTYRTPEVLELLAESFVAVRVDADNRPDLAERYAQWGWPATALLTPDAQPIVELRGHQPPRRFAELLRGLSNRLRAGETIGRERPPPVDTRSADLDAVRRSVTAQLDAMYDDGATGWGRGNQRYPFSAPVEHAFFRGEPTWRARAIASLDNYAHLIDPVWGGMFQYSDDGTWDAPHYEKIVSVQAGAIESFAAAYRITGNRVWLNRALDIERYVLGSLRDPSGAFYTSQDADVGTRSELPFMTGAAFYGRSDAERRRVGAPFIDRNIYASTTGMLIAAFVAHYEATLESDVLTIATTAADRILSTHWTSRGFAHSANDTSTIHLSDQAQMARALLALYQATGDVRWKAATDRTVRTMIATLTDTASGGFFAHTADPNAIGSLAERRLPLLDNGVAARTLVRLAFLDHDEDLRFAAERALRGVADPDVIAGQGRIVGEYLLALEELASSHVLLSVVGPADDPRSAALFQAALSVAEPRRLVELGRPGESRYPYPGEPAVYLCSESSCSMPVMDPAGLTTATREFLAAEGQ